LLVNQNGHLVITVKELNNNLIDLVNHLDFDIYLWPRISSNYIFENYVRNCDLINNNNNKNFQENYAINRSAAIFMHCVPAKNNFKFSYDFIGTNQFPIENLSEQTFFMFGRINSSTNSYELSNSMCKIYQSKDHHFKISFVQEPPLNLFYLTLENDKQQEPPIYHILLNNDNNTIEKLTTKSDAIRQITLPSFPFNFKLELNVGRLTIALNDDYKSEINQTEILRLTSDFLNINLERQSTQVVLLETSCAHLQLDNQMFDLNDENCENRLLLNLKQKYDFPVIFLPSAIKNLSSETIKLFDFPFIKNYKYNSFNSNEQLRFSDNLNDPKFLKLKLLFNNYNNNSEKLKLVDVDFSIEQFECYLEDFLIYNLIKIVIEFASLMSSSSCVAIESTEYDVYDLVIKDLDVLVEPALMIKQIRLSKLNALISLQTSMKLYLATYKMPVYFDELKIIGFPLAIM
jgi:hypothetical protein